MSLKKKRKEFGNTMEEIGKKLISVNTLLGEADNECSLLYRLSAEVLPEPSAAEVKNALAAFTVGVAEARALLMEKVSELLTVLEKNKQEFYREQESPNLKIVGGTDEVRGES
jgi:hypothetical protein